jgi:hypothetical protein
MCVKIATYMYTIFLCWYNCMYTSVHLLVHGTWMRIQVTATYDQWSIETQLHGHS